MGGNFKLNKKLLTFMAACLMATGIGALVTNNTHVEATTFINEEGYSVYDEKTAYNELRRASLITPRLNYTGKKSIKIHWYKKAHLRNGWNNINVPISWDVFGGDRGNSNFGMIATIGTATVNHRKYSIFFAQGDHLDFGDSSTFEQPQLVKSKLPLLTYSMDGSKDHGYYVAESGTLPLSNIIIPTHHNVITFPYREEGGKLEQFVPTGDGYLISKEQYDNLITNPIYPKNVLLNGDNNGNVWSSKNGKVYRVKKNAKSAKYELEFANLALHNKKWHKSALKEIYFDFKRAMENVHEIGNNAG